MPLRFRRPGRPVGPAGLPPRGRTLTAGLAALTGLALLPLTGASAAPSDDLGRAAASASADPLPGVSPRPQSVTRTGQGTPLPSRARVVAADGADQAAVDTVVEALHKAGISTAAGDGAALTVRIGGPDEAAATRAVRDGLHAAAPRGLPSGGYVLATGRVPGTPGPQAVLSGADATGTYYAAQTFRQVLTAADHDAGRPVLPSVAVRDWPTMSWRGVIEGYYGEPWTQADRLRQLDFYGAHKMNTYVYAPKDDPYHREKWREPYPADKLNDLRALDARARARHVDFVFAISPGLDVCYSSPDDLAALEKKAQAVWDVGVRTFGLFLDDIGGGLHCDADKTAFGGDADPLAAAQAHLLNAFRADFVATHRGAGRLLTVPTEYSGTQSSTYRTRFAELVDRDIVLYWTGNEVVSDTVSTADADAASAVFRHDLLLWDNYPVNDYLPRRLFLGPLKGRDARLNEHGVIGVTANPMPQSEPAKIALATVGDYTWNPHGYRPEQSWESALHEIGGPAYPALRALADNSRSSDLDGTESPRLTALIKAFWAEHEAGSDGPATAALIDEFTTMEHARSTLADALGDPEFVRQADPWLVKLSHFGAAGAAATRALAAQTDGDDATAWAEWRTSDHEADAARSYETLATGVLPDFFTDAAKERTTVAAQVPERADAGSDVHLGATVRAGATDVAKVEFYAGPKKIGEDATAPYALTWAVAPTGLHLVTARAVAADGTHLDSAVSRLTVGDPKPVLLLVGDDAPIPQGETMSEGDAAVRDRLEYLGRPVTVMPGGDATPQDAAGKAAVLLSSTLTTQAVKGKFTDAAVPVLTWESYLYDSLGMATGGGETFGVSQLRITDPGGPLAAGLTGDVTVYRGEDRIRWATPGADAEVAAESVDDTGAAHPALFGYRKGDRMAHGTAPAARVALFLGDDGVAPDVISEDGLRLFDNAVTWALG